MSGADGMGGTGSVGVASGVDDVLRHPARALERFGDALGIDPAAWAAREGLAELTYTMQDLDRGRAVSLPLDTLRDLSDAYGDALSCRFLLGELPVLEVTPALGPADLARFRADTDGSPTVVLDVALDKERLARRLCGDVPAYCRVVLYLFPETLARFLTRGLEDLEARLWEGDGARKVILIVPERPILLDGAHLGIVGGDALGAWRALVPATPPPVERVAHMRAARAELLSWQGLALAHLAPPHFDVAGEARPGDDIAGAVWAHLAELCVLYTANRTVVAGDGSAVATYSGARKSAEVALATRREAAGDEARDGARGLARLVEWAYDPHWSTARSADRLSIVQTSVVGALSLADRADRYGLLLRRAAALFADVQWLWQSFLEEKIDDYLARVQDLEDYVDKTVQAVVDQGAGLIKGVSDTTLAAIGALLASSIAALVSNRATPALFTIGMAVYAAYVLVFPLAYNMSNQWASYRDIVAGFEARRARFEAQLSPGKVADIVGRRVADTGRRFERTFRLTLAVYAVVVALALLAAWLLPGMLY